MSNSWQKAYSGLKDYIAGNPKIEIGKTVIAIPGDVRPEFYRVFDTVRVAFLKEKFQTLLDEAIPLSKNYAEIGQEVTKSLRLADIKVSASLSWFLNNPVNGLIRSLFDPLFDLIKSKIDTDTFEHVALTNIENSFSKLFRSGYEKWVVLSLANLLAPDKAHAVPVGDAHMDSSETDGDVVPGLREEPVPEPKETKHLSLGHMGEAVFIVPDFIVHSAKLNRYVSIRTDIAEASWTARLVSDKREWYHLRSLMRQYTAIAHWPDLAIYIDEQPEDLALVADFGRFCRPDMIVECMEQADWYQQGGLDRVKRNHDFLKPRLGSYVVSRLPVPEEAFKELMPEPVAREPAVEGATSIEPEPEKVSGEPEKQPLDIHIITAGYDQSQLAPIIDTLLPSEEATEEPGNQ